MQGAVEVSGDVLEALFQERILLMIIEAPFYAEIAGPWARLWTSRQAGMLRGGWHSRPFGGCEAEGYFADVPRDDGECFVLVAVQ